MGGESHEVTDTQVARKNVDELLRSGSEMVDEMKRWSPSTRAGKHWADLTDGEREVIAAERPDWPREELAMMRWLKTSAAALEDGLRSAQEDVASGRPLKTWKYKI